MVMLTAHVKDLGGGMMVRRLLPAAARQAVGPFLFFDHFGPVVVPAGAQQDVRPHPHIGLATITYLFEGATDHRDSLGSFQRIEPGAINLMTAGRGIVHSERAPADLKQRDHRQHGLQLWVALPAELEECAPAFSHTAAADIPTVNFDGASVRVLVGQAFGARSPVPAHSETLYLDVQLAPGGELRLDGLAPEAAVYPIEGSLRIDSTALPDHTMLVLEPGQAATACTDDGARFVVIGGAPLGHRHIWWNFVSSRRERLLQAGEDWQAQRFPPVPGETEFIPLPARPAA